MFDLTRRKFFFLGLGLMGGKIMYPSMYDRWPKGLYIPTQKQIDFLRNGEWNHVSDAVSYMDHTTRRSHILASEIDILIRQGKPGYKIVVEKLTFGTIITRYEKV